MKTLGEIQKEHYEWARRNFGDFEAWQTLLGLQEELGELSHSYLKRHAGIRMNEDHDAKIKDAVADILVFLCGFCSTQEIDLEKQLNVTWEEVKKRDYRK